MTGSTIAIIGTGVIGSGWAARMLAHGHHLQAWDPNPDFVTTLPARVERILARIGNRAPGNGSLTCSASLESACEGASWVQESAPEDMAVKQALLARIDGACDGTTIVASSSSGLLPSEMQAGLNHPERFLVAHPFNPVYLLPLVELVAGEQTAAETVAQAGEFYSALGMKPLVVRKEIEGYLSDRLQEALWREALHLVNDDIATTGELDDAIIYGPGLRWAFMGTCLTFHLAGGESGMRHMLEQFGPALELPWTRLKAPELTDSLIDKMVNGTASQAGNRSIDELESLRDQCLIDIMAALRKFEIGAGALAATSSQAANEPGDTG